MKPRHKPTLPNVTCLVVGVTILLGLLGWLVSASAYAGQSWAVGCLLAYLGYVSTLGRYPTREARERFWRWVAASELPNGGPQFFRLTWLDYFLARATLCPAAQAWARRQGLRARAGRPAGLSNRPRL